MESLSSSSLVRLPGSLEPAHEEHRLEPVPHPKGVWLDWGPALPVEYRQDRLCLLVRDPSSLFAYWELTGTHAQWIPERHGPGAFASGKWRVRLYRGNSLMTELEGTHPLGAHYFAVEPDASWRAEVGLALPTGEWIIVAASEEVRTPRAWIAGVTDDDWPVTEMEMLNQLGFTPEEAARRADLFRRSGGLAGYQSETPGPGASSR